MVSIHLAPLAVFAPSRIEKVKSSVAPPPMNVLWIVRHGGGIVIRHFENKQAVRLQEPPTLFHARIQPQPKMFKDRKSQNLFKSPIFPRPWEHIQIVDHLNAWQFDNVTVKVPLTWPIPGPKL